MGDVITINRAPGDFVKDTQHLTTIEVGAYQMICDQIVTRGQDADPPSIADDDVMLASIVRLSQAQWRKIKPRLCQGDTAVLSIANGRLFQLRLAFEIEEAKRRIKGQSAKGRKSGEVRRAKADLKRRFLEGTGREPDANSGSSPVRTAEGTSHESRVMSHKEPSVPREREAAASARARRAVTPETEAWLRMKVREMRNDPALWELASNDPDEFEQQVRDKTGWSPAEVADITGDEAMRRVVEVSA